LGLLTIARKGRENEKEGKQQAEGEITENAKEGLH
jgi:hypothetical protein